jgi:creatinine amidohydrolase
MPVMERVTMPVFDEGRKTRRTVILPCGALEEHGPHLPLGTDALHAVALANAAAERSGAWAAPPVYYGLCRSSSLHPGTVGIRGGTLRAIVEDVIRGFYGWGMRQAVILSGHAGGTHMASLLDAGEQLLADLPEIRIAVLSVLDLGKTAWRGLLETPGDSHAGEMETSVMLHLHPEWVTGSAPEEYPTFPEHILVRGKRAFWPGGVWGNPGAATVGKGAAFFERSVGALLGLIEKLENWSEPESPQTP